MRKTAFEVGIDRQVNGVAERSEMFADIIDGDAVVGAADRPRIARAGRGDDDPQADAQ